MKVTRPDDPSGKFVELDGEELENLIEVDGPVEPYADTQAVSIDPECSSTPGGESPSLKTGPGRRIESTERVHSSSISPHPPVRTRRTASNNALSRPDQTASLRKSRMRRQHRPASRLEAEIDEMLGETLGSYRILSLLGEGGMGRVYLAEHIKLGRRVALKLLRPEYSVKRDAVSRFFHEARAVNKIGHENIVDITDFVELESGETFIIMELLKGEDLADIQRKSDRPIPLHRAMQIALQVCEALAAAHLAEIIHRDLKPDNIFIVNDGAKRDFVKLLDFGVAKLLDSKDSDGWQTQAGSVIGTPAYMSPEQASGIPVDRRSDIYSLGAILYELFTGHPVFRAKSFGEFVVKHMNDDPVPPRDLADAPRIPIALEQVILRCLKKDPEKRYQTVEELREDLARATATVETQIRAPTKPSRRKHRRALLLAILGASVTTLAIAAFWLASGLDLPETASSPLAKNRAPTTSPGIQSDDRQAAAAKDDPRITTARLTLRSRPSGAQVFRKGKMNVVLGQTPLDLQLPNIGDQVEFVFRLPGYKDGVASVVVADNTVIGVDLELDSTASRSPAGAQTVRKPSQHRRQRGLRKPRAPKSRTVPRKEINPEEQLDPFK